MPADMMIGVRDGSPVWQISQFLQENGGTNAHNGARMTPKRPVRRCTLIILAFAAQLLLACNAGFAADRAQEKEQALKQLRAAIAKKMTFNCGVVPKKRAVVQVKLQPNGYLIGLALVESSGSSPYDAALMSAITGAQPFKLPANAESRKSLLDLNLKFYTDGTPVPPCK